MDIRDSKVLVLGGYGLVGTAVCRELLTRFGIEADGLVVECRGMGAGSCVIDVSPALGRTTPIDVEAA